MLSRPVIPWPEKTTIYKQETEGRIDEIVGGPCGILIGQKLSNIHMLDPLVISLGGFIHGNDDFSVIVID